MPCGYGTSTASTLALTPLPSLGVVCREEYLAESAARLAASAGEVADVEKHAQRTKAPLAQAAGGPVAAAGGSGCG